MQNLITHDIVIVTSDDPLEDVVYPPSDIEARVDTKQKFIGIREDGVHVYSPPILFGLTNMPKVLKSDVIVSMMVGKYLQDNTEELSLNGYKVYGPDTGPKSVVKNDKGFPRGVKQLIQYLPVHKSQ